MNNIWSKHIQGAKTLYCSRKLRFDDMFGNRYIGAFGLDFDKPLKILEIGCGPGALAGALHRWYPKAEIIGLDRDSELIKFASEHESGCRFIEGDATALPFPDESFDAVISNTVSEHIEPSKFYGEQFRVLKHGGICLVLSARRGINSTVEFEESTFEEKFWEKLGRLDDRMQKFSVGKYAANESELPRLMEKYGFANVTTDFAVIPLIPDDPKFSTDMAHAIINAERYSQLEGLDAIRYTFPEYFSEEETEEMKRLTDKRFDERITRYDKGEKLWDCFVSVTQIVRGIKE